MQVLGRVGHGKLQRLRAAVGEAVDREHRAAAGVLHRTDITDDGVGAQAFRAYQAVRAAVAEDLAVFEAVYLRQKLRNSHLAREHADDDVLLVHVRQRQDSVHLADVVRPEHRLTRAVRADDVHLGVFFGEVLAPRALHLDELDACAGFYQHRSEVFGDPAAADDEHVFAFFAAQLQLVRKLDERRCRRGDVYFIALAQNKAAVGDKDLFLAQDRADEDMHPYFPAQIGKLKPVKRAAVGNEKLDYLGLALGKGIALYEGRDLQQTVDLLGGQKLGVYGHGQAKLRLENVKLLGILKIAHARDGVFTAELARYDARKHVQLVLRRDGDEQVALVNVCLALDGYRRAVAAKGHDIKRVGQKLYLFLFYIDHGYIVVLIGQLLGKRIAYLACADYYDLHFSDPLNMSILKNPVTYILTYYLHRSNTAAHPVNGIIGKLACRRAVAAGFGYCEADNTL